MRNIIFFNNPQAKIIVANNMNEEKPKSMQANNVVN